ncbi:aromatase/cyclase [Streptomyces kanamyceticus]|uniref:Cyclase n=1 Tax=Streptomyces kanamyceticus TaxID=1967 RepID=A0A5J6GTB6_STRKN|nr:aromatase/cyclase [Streptomyces kanamyceticus]QEU96256.1 cyclase [Streptomyces kanamyceticus]
MTQPVTHETEHTITVAAAADVVFELIENVGRWPVTFPPTVHAEQLERSGNTERIRLWATANGTAKGWTSRRELDLDGLRVRFRQEVSQPPVAAMGGEWVIEPLPAGGTLVRLLHDFRAVDDDPAATEWIRQAVDRNSGKELAALRDAAEQRERRADLLLTFSDTVRVAGAAKDVYDFLDRADAWPRRLPHVARAELTEDTPGLQTLEMDTRTADGSTHTTESVRVCFPYDRIVYKQLRTPALMSAHTGEWTVREDGTDTVVTSTHTVVVNPGAIAGVLGADAGVAEARAFVRDALGRNSTVTMLHAKEHAEGVARG